MSAQDQQAFKRVLDYLMIVQEEIVITHETIQEAVLRQFPEYEQISTEDFDWWEQFISVLYIRLTTLNGRPSDDALLLSAGRRSPYPDQQD